MACYYDLGLVVWCGLVWPGVGWCGLMWVVVGCCGLVWVGVAWCGLVWVFGDFTVPKNCSSP